MINLFQKLITVMVVTAMVLAALPATPTYAVGTITVTTTSDVIATDGECSLREAVLATDYNATYNECIYPGGGPDDVITLQSGATYTLSRVGSSSTTGDLDIGDPENHASGNLTIQASGPMNAIIDANDINRVIEVDGGDINLTLEHITVTNGNTSSISDRGAGIYFWGNGTLTLNNSTVSSNTSTTGANCGAGIYNNSLATIIITNSTIEGNTCNDVEATADGGGMYKAGGGVLTITNSTFANNSTPDNGGGLRISMPGGTTTITNSTFANNTAGGRGGGIQVKAGTVTISFSTFSGNAANITTSTSTGGAVQADGGSVNIVNSILANSITNSAPGKDCDQISPGVINLSNSLVENNNDCVAGTGVVSNDPNLGSLADNGGPTQTIALLVGSPAINADGATCSPANDQRGISRPQGVACDFGSYEAIPDNVAPTLLSFALQNPATSPTNANTLVFRASFSEAVTQLDTADIVVDGTTTATVTNVTPISTSVYDVTVSGGDLAIFNGVVGLNLSGSQNIKDLAGNALPPGEPTTDQTYTVDNSLSSVNIKIGESDKGLYTVPSVPTLIQNYLNELDGPVKVIDTQGEKIFTSQRAYYGSSYNEVMGYPADQFTTEYWFPWYDQVFMQTWILVSNPSTTQTAYVDIYIGGSQRPDQDGNVVTYQIPAGGNVTPQFPGIVDGPVRVVSVTGTGTPTPIDIFASERSLYGDSFNEVMGYPGNKLTTEYWFPWYDQQFMQSWVLVGNPSTTETAYVKIYINGTQLPDEKGNIQTYTIDPGERIIPQFPGVLDGPVQVVSVTGPGTLTPAEIFASERSLYGTSFNEVMGYPADEFSTEYYYTWYDNIGMQTWLLVGNPSTTQDAYVDIYIGGQRLPDLVSGTVQTYKLQPGERIIPQFNANSGPVRIVSVTGTGTPTPVPIFTSERSLLGPSFNEMMGYPVDQLTSEYWFPWYDTTYMDTDILVGRP